jgi:ferredoxin
VRAAGFGYAIVLEPGDMIPADDSHGSFEIHLIWSDQILDITAGRSALEVLLEAKVPIEPGCMTGGCGECATPYLEGDIVHMDTCLNEADRKRYFCPCVSRAKTRIVLAY